MATEKNIIIGIGRRKSAVARVFLSKAGKKINITVNKKKFNEYFPTMALQKSIFEPLRKLELDKKFSFNINVQGGGMEGQAGACLHGIARAIVQYDSELREVLKMNNLLTRDSRVKERKKAGRPGARKKFQFSKR